MRLLFWSVCYHGRQVKSLKRDGGTIAVNFREKQKAVVPNNKLCLALVNAVTNADIERFTKTYGPLTATIEISARHGDVFFRIKQWKRIRTTIRNDFWNPARPALPESTNITKDDLWLCFNGGKVEHHARCLARLIVLYLATVPRELLQVCENPECQSPCMITAYKRATCGSRKCLRWKNAQRNREFRAKKKN